MFNSLWKSDLLTYVIIGSILLICLKIYSESELFSLKCVISTVDGNKYCVRDRTQINDAADLLAHVTKKCRELVDYVGKKYPNDPDVKRLVEGFNPQRISETLPTSELTAYSENKGEKIAFCLNPKKDGDVNNLIDEHTLTFVAIHELSHVGTKSIGHKTDFWENFKFLLTEAKEAGIHDPTDYKKKPTEYCSMPIKDNPYYDV